MKTLIIITLAFSISMTLGGCSSTPDKHPRSLQNEPQTHSSRALPGTNPAVIKLYAQHKSWKGTRYKLGGLSKKGIDCSGFVHITYKERFGKTLPRTTELQAKVGTGITRQQLRAGDLVFFNTSRKVRHVGIYIEDGKFLHASTSKGVMISNINNVYWKEAYWKAVRI